ncbi:glycosyl hydrolase [Metabacillus halosaccharovorans]|uniref:Glycosyl hydrolase n=1 Tax=Metabacillus halosaccharovorans TaxID=930124 RepID=A0ABT3DNS7_9BACI|nr:glycosyl hydrolase [Metabacillus halosaccharovorans]MCV9888715.1 glycosyl hydrolase [Metabacillus halosaccharovorans]
MKVTKKVVSILLALTLVFSSFPSVFASTADSDKRKLDLVDSNASEKTKSLFAYLQDVGGKRVLFGHQHATDEGLTITGSGTRVGSTQSEVKNSVGDYPAIFGWDTLSLDGDERPGSSENTNEQNRQNLITSMKAAHDLGGIVALSMHPPNFATGGRYNDTSSKDAVLDILPGGQANAIFNAWLDNLALFAHGLKDDKGELIPVIFRPFHEQNGGWFWWGAQTTTTSQYKELYRYTVEYLRDKKGVTNFLYAFSPNGPFDGNAEDYLKTYPGDDYVDILGLDQYDNQSNPGSDDFINKLVNDLSMISQLAEEKDKISAFTEYGYSPQGMKTTGNGDLEWFTTILNAIKSDPDAKKVSYMQTWANFALGGNLFVPYKGFKNAPEGGRDHELLLDFTKFYQDSYSAFLNEVGDPYRIKNLETVEEKPSMHIVTPTLNSELKTSPAKIRVKVLNDTPEKVVYTVEGTNEEIPMSLDEEGFYYTADWAPPASLNGGTADITVKALLSDRCTILQETSKVIVKVSEIEMKTYTFDENIYGVQNNGAYPAAITTNFEHAQLAGDGKLKIHATGLEQSQTWQEFKMELTDLDDVHLPSVKRVKFDALVPVTAKTTNASLLGVAMLPPDWETKYGESTTSKQFKELDTRTIEGVDYAQFSAVIDLNIPSKSEEATGLALSLIGKELNLDGDIYIDNIQLLSVFAEAPNDPSLVDDFESYLGSDAALATEFVAANGNVSISLDGESKNEGTYGLKYDYTLTPGAYTGVTKTLDNLDWSEYNHLQFWLAPDGQDQKLVIQIQIGGISFEAYPSLASTEAGLVKVPFSQFTPAPWDTANAGKVITKENLKSVSKFSIYINAQEELKNELSSTLYFDDIRVDHDGTGDVPNGGSGPGSMPQKTGTLYDFEEDEQGWSIEQNNANATNVEVTEEAAAKGTKSLTSEFDLEGTEGFEFSKVQSIDLSAVDAISAKVKLSEGTANARLYIKTGSDWAWVDSGVVEVDHSEFKTLTIDLAHVENRNRINAIGVKIEPTSGSNKAKAYIDNIELVGEGAGELKTEAEPDIELKAEFEEVLEAESEMRPKAEPETEDEVEAGQEAELETGSEAEGETGLDAELETEPEVEGETGLEAEFETKSEIKPEAEQSVNGEAVTVKAPNVLTLSEVVGVGNFLDEFCGNPGPQDPDPENPHNPNEDPEIDEDDEPEVDHTGSQPNLNNNNQDSSNQKPVAAVPVSRDDTLDNGNKLPDTSTNQFNWLLLGFITIAGGSLLFFVNRKRGKVS